MVNSIIVQHLKQHKRLVIPGFGAFIKKDDTGEVIFVEFLKKDDGVLVAALEQNYSLNRAEAAEVIENYVISTKKHIFNRGNFVIDSLGTMHIDANSVYNFEYDPSVRVESVKPAEARQVQKESIEKVIMSAPKPAQQSVAQSQPQVQPQAQTRPVAPQPAAQQTQQAQQVQPAQETKQEYAPKKQGYEDRSQDVNTIDVKGLRYQKPIKQVVPGHNKKKTDMIMLIAIIAATLAIIAMMYGMFSTEKPEVTLDPAGTVKTETSAAPVDATATKPTN